TFRELRAGETVDGVAMERLSTAMSTAEAVSVAHAVAVRGYFLRGGAAEPGDVVEGLAGTAAKGHAEGLKKLRRYFGERGSKRDGAHWRAFYGARHLLPG